MSTGSRQRTGAPVISPASVATLSFFFAAIEPGTAISKQVRNNVTVFLFLNIHDLRKRLAPAVKSNKCASFEVEAIRREIRRVKLIVQPGDGIMPLVQAINNAKKSVEILIFRFD